MEKKNFISLLLGALVVPMSANASGWVFSLIAPVILVNTPFRLIGAALFLLVVLLESFIVSRVIHVGYVSCAKRILLAKALSFLANILIFALGVLINWTFIFGENGLFSLVRQAGMVSDEQKAFIASKFTMILVIFFIAVTLVSMLLQYAVLSRLKIERKKLIKAIVFASVITYAVLMLLLVACDYFAISLISLR
ncbi:MAG: hypothetical protein NTZ68_01870 [Candidatus Dependentiae bacterium]|nr:hypothetical protein [Candidatus Dependentiae bacterium]